MEKIQDKSKEVKELIGKPPTWTLRAGTTTVLIGFVVLLLLSMLISYNDVVFAKVGLTTKNPIAKIKARTKGELDNIYVSHGDTVYKNEVLAEIKNPASLKDVYLIVSKLEDMGKHRNIRLDSLSILYPNDLQLGSVQEAYNTFYLNYQNLIINDSLRPNEKHSNQLVGQLEQEEDLLKGQTKELAHFQQQIKLSDKAHQRSETLLSKGVISQAEYEKISRERLSDRQELENIKTKINKTKINISQLQNQLDNNSISGIRTFGETTEVLKQSIQNLKNEIANWEESYILKSPINGLVSLFDTYDRFQSVENGETLFTVFPKETNGIIGTLKIPVLNSGKVKIGQKVIVKLDNYPHHQYGSLTAKVTGVSATPNLKDNTYSVFVSLDTLQTSHHYDLVFNQEMVGTAEIITEKLNLLERMFYGIRKMFSRKPNM